MSKKKQKSKVREYAETIIIALAIALVVRTFVVQAFKIPSESMKPTLLVGDHLLVNKFIYGIRIPLIGKRVLPLSTPQRGDVIVFIFPQDRSKDFIKRVIGLAGGQGRDQRAGDIHQRPTDRRPLGGIRSRGLPWL